MTKKQVGIYGAGGHARELALLASSVTGQSSLECVAYIDDCSDRVERLNDLPVMSYEKFRLNHPESLIVVGVGDPGARRILAEKCIANGQAFASLVHDSVDISRYIELGAGSVVCAGSILTTNIKLGAHVHVNIGCTISHDVSIGNYSTLSPGVHVAGNVSIGADVFVGIGASIINGTPDKQLTIHNGCRIGAGACVTSSLNTRGVYKGVPARLSRTF